MTAKDIVRELKPLGREGYKKILFNHGVTEPCLGVKIEDLKKFQRRIRKDHRLALDLYDTGIYDVMYLAGLIADETKMTRRDLQRWVKKANRGSLSGTTVPAVAAETPHGWELALEWIDSSQDFIAASGWATLSAVASIRNDDDLDLSEFKRLLQRVQDTIHQAPDIVRYQMNAFVIAVGASVKPLTATALRIGEKIGPVTADLGNNACQIPFAPDYIRKIEKRGAIGRKRKSARC
jgi:3-methyladenine DNA glycosylase AlkD